jgi:hypothetical protein
VNALLRFGLEHFLRRRHELAKGRAAIARLAQTVSKASRVLELHADDLEGEVSGQHDTIPPNEPQPPR